ncbi:MAG: hypothetical protein JRG96_10850 [Deltaproteobacteria bacterium]|nr:hypothetical protein [Deltaproteobacteria bacterium]
MNRNRSSRAAFGPWRRGLLPTLLLTLLAPPALADKKAEDAEKAAKATKSQEAATAEVVPNTWYVSTLSETERGILGVHYWSKGPLFRAETIVEGHRIATIVNAGSYYIINVVSGTGIEIGRSERAMSEDAARGRPFGREFEALVRDGGEKVRSRELGGVGYDVYRVTDKAGRREILVTRSEPRIPVSVETYNRKTGQSTVVRYMNWRRGLDVTDAFFEPPQGVEVPRLEYAEYVEKITTGSIGPAPVLYEELLHGQQER